MSDPVSSSDSINPDDVSEINRAIEMDLSASGQDANDLAEVNVPGESTEALSSELQDPINGGASIEDEQQNVEAANSDSSGSRRQRQRNNRGTRNVRRRQTNAELRNLEFEMNLPSTEVLRSMSLRGIYYDRRNHGWQVRIRKRQTEVSRYFSAKRYGVEKSYEMALRFYQVNIVGSNLFGDLPSVVIPKLPDPEDDHRCSVCIAEEPNLDVIDLSIGALKLKEKMSSLNNISNIANGNSSQCLNGGDVINSTKVLKSQNTTSSLTNLSLLVSHLIPNGLVNNTVPSQLVQSNLLLNNMYNMASAVSFQSGTIPIRNFVNDPYAALYGRDFVLSLNIPFSFISPYSPNTTPVYVNDHQESVNDNIIKALSNAESIWRGLSFDNRNNCWYLRIDSDTIKLFNVKEHGPIDSLVLAFQQKYSNLGLSLYKYYIKTVIGGNVAILQKFMSIYGLSKTTGDESIQDSEQPISRHFKDMSISERFNYFNIDDLVVFINISIQLGYLVNSLLIYRSTQTLLPGNSSTYLQQLNYLPTVLNTNQSANNGPNIFNCPTNQSGILLSPHLFGHPFFQNKDSSVPPESQSPNRK
ncbi:hypothetical protein FG386_000391 [Cryptosporidium ryanae]|uniref:uncharacterized protein n=1 Tax=Cryptosporidium ryanae TaxID=515981 RepID=UPI00351A243E|nr:hypothetical protein FG386_000391 [Cryptosporidium ryanae]